LREPLAHVGKLLAICDNENIRSRIFLQKRFMDNELKELTAILSREQEIFQSYLEILTEQQNHLMANDLEAIQVTVDKIDALTREATELENGRRGLLAAITRPSRLNPDEINLTKLLEKLGGPIFQEFVKLNDTLIDIQKRINEQRIRNELLIDQSMQMISNSVRLTREADDPEAAYEIPVPISGTAKAREALVSRMA
jgi:hypothetical protein